MKSIRIEKNTSLQDNCRWSLAIVSGSLNHARRFTSTYLVKKTL